MLKKELKALVMSKLVELELVEMPVQTEPAVVEDAILGGEAGRIPLKGTPPRTLISGVAHSQVMKLRRLSHQPHCLDMIPSLLPSAVLHLKRKPA